MNGKELLDKMSEVDPKLIEGAYKDAEKPKSKRALFIGLGSGMAAVAAALAVVIGVKAGLANKDSVGTAVSGENYSTAANGIDNLPATNGNGGTENTSADKGGVDASEPATISTQAPESVNLTPEAVIDSDFSEYGNLPKISNNDYGMRGGGYSREEFGLYSVYNYGEEPRSHSYETFAPWSIDAELTTLPVYLSNSTTPDLAAMKARAIAAAEALGIPESDLEITVDDGTDAVVGGLDRYRAALEKDGIPQEEIDAEIDRLTRTVMAMADVTVKCGVVDITAYTDGSLWFYFNEPYPELPEGYNLDEHNPSPEVLAATVEYLAEEYKEIFGYQNPKVAREEGNFEYEYRVYDTEGDLGTQIVNYWLNYGEFLPNWENTREMHMLRKFTTDNLEKLGDYPIYTAAQALWVMQSDRVPEEVRIPEDAEILKVELEYSNRVGYTAVIPYYVFTVKTDEISQFTGGLVHKHYRIPAVPEQFLDMTVEDYGVRA